MEGTTETPPEPTQPTPSPEPTPPKPPEQPVATEGKGEGRVPYERFAEVEKARKEAEAKLKQIEEENLSEVEKAQKKAVEAERKLADAEARALRLERSGIARAAATEQNFVDPEDAIAMLDLSDLDTDAKIVKAVKDLAGAKPHLLRQPQAAGFGQPGGGSPATPGNVPLDEEGNPDERLGLGQDLLAHLRRTTR